MPADPTPAQSAASRANGARSNGPASAAGRARIAAAATRHGLTGAFGLLPGECADRFAALAAAWRARLRPEDPAEAAAVDKIVAAVWRERRLDLVEDRVLQALGEGRVEDGLPSLSTLIRYRARLERDRRNAEADLAALRARPGAPERAAADAPPAPAGTGRSGEDAGRAAAGGLAIGPAAAPRPEDGAGPASAPAPGGAPRAGTAPPSPGLAGPAAGPPVAPAHGPAELDLDGLLRAAEQELAARLRAPRVADPLAAVSRPPPARDLATSASAAAIAWARRAAA